MVPDLEMCCQCPMWHADAHEVRQIVYCVWESGAASRGVCTGWPRTGIDRADEPSCVRVFSDSLHLGASWLPFGKLCFCTGCC